MNLDAGHIIKRERPVRDSEYSTELIKEVLRLHEERDANPFALSRKFKVPRSVIVGWIRSRGRKTNY